MKNFFIKTAKSLVKSVLRQVTKHQKEKRKARYKQYMRSDGWELKRKERLKIDKYTCQHCKAKNTELHVHHLTYKRFTNEEMSDLITLCKKCHDAVHRR